MDLLLRGLIRCAGAPDEEGAMDNYQRVLDAEADLEFPTIEDKKLLGFIKDFHTSTGVALDAASVRRYFESLDDVEAVNRLEEVSRAMCYVGSNYRWELERLMKDQWAKRQVRLLREVAAVAEHGLVLKDEKRSIRGPEDAARHLVSRLHVLLGRQDQAGGASSFVRAREDLIRWYEEAEKADESRHLSFGFPSVDAACSGFRPGQLWIHAAFAGELKSTTAQNFAYWNFVKGKKILYVTLEMTAKQVLQSLLCLHSSNYEFVSRWHGEDGYIGLDYRKVRDGKLSPRDRERLREVVDSYARAAGDIDVWLPQGRTTPADVLRRAEMLERRWGRLDGIVVDHLGLLDPSVKWSDYVPSANDVIREVRMTALTFAGRGIPVLGLAQMNRTGKRTADKSEGRYDLMSLSYANELEKSADVVTYTYLSEEMRSEGHFFLGCLKNRDNPFFERIRGRIMWPTRRMAELTLSERFDSGERPRQLEVDYLQ